MLSLDQIRLEMAQLQGELSHLSSTKFPAIPATVAARLAALKQGEQTWEVNTHSQAASYAPPHPSEVERKRQRAIASLTRRPYRYINKISVVSRWPWRPSCFATSCIISTRQTTVVTSSLSVSSNIMPTNGPGANIGRILDVDIPHPRKRMDVMEHPNYYSLRSEIIYFLNQQKRINKDSVA